MVSISCSNLERTRKNSTRYAELLHKGEGLNRGGTYGMFAHWQETAKKMHTGEYDLAKAIQHLQFAFGNFADTTRNRDKQAYLLEEFARYSKVHKQHKLEFHEPKHQFKWSLIPEVRLTGITPWVFKQEEMHYAYFCLEKQTVWQAELKYPLLQRYLADHVLHCRLSQLQIGVYCLEERQFDFKRYTPLEVKNAVQEATQLFTNFYTEYSRLSEDAGHKS
jgi:hypothetical protein